jgi:hypothetical protein
MAVCPSTCPGQASMTSHHSSQPRPVASRSVSSAISGSDAHCLPPSADCSMRTRRAAPYRSPVFSMRCRIRRLKVSCRVISTAFPCLGRISPVTRAHRHMRGHAQLDPTLCRALEVPFAFRVGGAGTETKVGRGKPPIGATLHPVLFQETLLHGVEGGTGPGRHSDLDVDVLDVTPDCLR